MQKLEASGVQLFKSCRKKIPGLSFPFHHLCCVVFLPKLKVTLVCNLIFASSLLKVNSNKFIASCSKIRLFYSVVDFDNFSPNVRTFFERSPLICSSQQHAMAFRTFPACLCPKTQRSICLFAFLRLFEKKGTEQCVFVCEVIALASRTCALLL